MATSASAAAAVQDEPATKFAKDQLKAIIERIERLEEEKKTISDDIRDVYAEAKGNGFDGWIEQQRLWGVYADEKVE